MACSVTTESSDQRMYVRPSSPQARFAFLLRDPFFVSPNAVKLRCAVCKCKLWTEPDYRQDILYCDVCGVELEKKEPRMAEMTGGFALEHAITACLLRFIEGDSCRFSAPSFATVIQRFNLQSRVLAPNGLTAMHWAVGALPRNESNVIQFLTALIEAKADVNIKVQSALFFFLRSFTRLDSEWCDSHPSDRQVRLCCGMQALAASESQCRHQECRGCDDAARSRADDASGCFGAHACRCGRAISSKCSRSHSVALCVSTVDEARIAMLCGAFRPRRARHLQSASASSKRSRSHQ